MIITKIKGGLGNQMFEYATGRFLAYKTGADLYLDANQIPSHKKEISRDFDLIKFNIQAKPASIEEIQKIKNPFGRISDIMRKISQKIFFKYRIDFHPSFLKKIENKLKKNKSAYVEGYFQSEKNFLEIREILLQELSLKEEFKSETFKDLQTEIQNCHSVSVHVRRGDYVQNPGARRYHGICSLKYYQNAINTIKESVENPSFYFFSDDPAWVSENFDLSENSEIISDKNLSAPEELILMSTCKHNIISNSTFSWWGAWLNKNHDKLVIAPTPWIQQWPSPHKNIIPETWIQLPKNH
ncbi:MAG: alpha-1,2-fucosyltransferase [Candidatus Paceibacterota bacterium]